MKCKGCRWHFALAGVHERTGWKNCLALPYPTCVETMTNVDAECIVPEKFSSNEETDHGNPRLQP